MSRSIHSTRADYNKEYYFDYTDEKAKESNLEKISDAVFKKSRLKKDIIKARKRADSEFTHSLPIEIEAINITFDEESDLLHFPVTKEDVLGVLEYMPKDILIGLDSINFCLDDKLEKYIEKWCFDKRFAPEKLTLEHEAIIDILGYYITPESKIQVFPFIYSKESIKLDVIIPFLKMRMLSTLIHEIGHHDDFMRRNGRGILFNLNSKKDEVYAENFEQIWAKKAVLPYLYKAYPDDYERLTNWIHEFGGIEIPLEVFFGEKTESFFTNYIGSLMSLFQDVMDGKSKYEYQERFASNLRSADYYEKSLSAYDLMLVNYPNDSKILTEKARVLIDLKRFEEARDCALQAFELDNNSVYAMLSLCKIYFELEIFEKCLEFGNLGYETNKEDLWLNTIFLDYMAHSNLLLNNYTFIDELKLEELAKSTIFKMQAYKAISLLIQKKYEEGRIILNEYFPFNSSNIISNWVSNNIFKSLHNRLNLIENQRAVFNIDKENENYLIESKYSILIDRIS